MATVKEWLPCQLTYHLDPATGVGPANAVGRELAKQAAAAVAVVPNSLPPDQWQQLQQLYPNAVHGGPAPTPDTAAVEADLLAQSAGMDLYTDPDPRGLSVGDGLTWPTMADMVRLGPVHVLLRTAPTITRFRQSSQNQMVQYWHDGGRLSHRPVYGRYWRALDSLHYSASHVQMNRGLQFARMRSGVFYTHYEVSLHGVVGCLPRPIMEHMIPHWAADSGGVVLIPPSAYEAAATAVMGLSAADLTPPKILRSTHMCCRRLVIANKVLVEAAHLNAMEVISLAAHLAMLALEAQRTVGTATTAKPITGWRAWFTKQTIANAPELARLELAISRLMARRSELVVGVYGDSYRVDDQGKATPSTPPSIPDPPPIDNWATRTRAKVMATPDELLLPLLRKSLRAAPKRLIKPGRKSHGWLVTRNRRLPAGYDQPGAKHRRPLPYNPMWRQTPTAPPGLPVTVIDSQRHPWDGTIPTVEPWGAVPVSGLLTYTRKPKGPSGRRSRTTHRTAHEDVVPPYVTAAKRVQITPWVSIAQVPTGPPTTPLIRHGQFRVGPCTACQGTGTLCVGTIPCDGQHAVGCAPCTECDRHRPPTNMQRPGVWVTPPDERAPSPRSTGCVFCNGTGMFCTCDEDDDEERHAECCGPCQDCMQTTQQTMRLNTNPVSMAVATGLTATLVVQDGYDPACGLVPTPDSPRGFCSFDCWMPRNRSLWGWARTYSNAYHTLVALMEGSPWPWDAREVAQRVFGATNRPMGVNRAPRTAYYTPGHWSRDGPGEAHVMWFTTTRGEAEEEAAAALLQQAWRNSRKRKQPQLLLPGQATPTETTPENSGDESTDTEADGTSTDDEAEPLANLPPDVRRRGGGDVEPDWTTDLAGWLAWQERRPGGAQPPPRDDGRLQLHGPLSATPPRATCDKLELSNSTDYEVTDLDWHCALDWLRREKMDNYGASALRVLEKKQCPRRIQLAHLPGCAGSGKTTYIIDNWAAGDLYVSPLSLLHRDFCRDAGKRGIDTQACKTWMRALANPRGATRIWLDEGYSVGMHYIVLLAAVSDATIVVVGDPYQSTHQTDPTNKQVPWTGRYCTTTRRCGPMIMRALKTLGNSCIQTAMGPDTTITVLTGPHPPVVNTMAHTMVMAQAQSASTIRSMQGVTVSHARLVMGAVNELCYSPELNYVALTRAKHQLDILLLTGDVNHEWGSLGNRNYLEQVTEPMAVEAATGRPAPGPPPTDKPLKPVDVWPMTRVQTFVREYYQNVGYERKAPKLLMPANVAPVRTTDYTRAQIAPVTPAMITTRHDVEFELHTAAARYAAHVRHDHNKIAELARRSHQESKLPVVGATEFDAEMRRQTRRFLLDHRYKEDRLMPWDRVRAFMKVQSKAGTPKEKAGQPIRMHSEDLLWTVGIAYRAAEQLLLRLLPDNLTYANGMSDSDVMTLLGRDFNGPVLCGDYSAFDGSQNNATAVLEAELLAECFPAAADVFRYVPQLRETERRSLHQHFVVATGSSKASGEPGTLLTNTLLNLLLLARAYPGERAMAKGDDFIIANPRRNLATRPKFQLRAASFSVNCKWDTSGSFCQFRRGTHGRWTIDGRRLLAKLLTQVPASAEQWRHLQAAVQFQLALADPLGDEQEGAKSSDVLCAAWSIVSTRHDKIPLWAVDYGPDGSVARAIPATRAQLRQQLSAAGQQLQTRTDVWSTPTHVSLSGRRAPRKVM